MLPAAAAEPDADQLLRQMSDKLSSARSFSFKAYREIDPALLAGTPAAEKACIRASVLRPNKLAAHAKTNLGGRHFYADGRTLSLLDEKANTYATLPMHTNIDGVVAALDERYGFTPPLAEFAVSNPYRGIRQQAQSVAYVGREKVAAGFLGLAGVECHRLALKGKIADAELWIAVNNSLPRKLVATFRRAGHPQVRISFSSWNLAAAVTEAEFAFTPPKGAEKIEMWTPAQMASASKKVAARKN
ncbi:MAG: hypothetical protein QOE70_3930 [Chthoniobacter sp.]|jgi:hypothetical protein|nr:hypothetical protein [Chthoniobacter sp.]